MQGAKEFLKGFAEALKWYLRAAKQGDVEAQIHAGNIYRDATDYIQAHMWYNIAASRLKGDWRDGTLKDRDGIAARMSSAEISEAQRLARDWSPQLERS